MTTQTICMNSGETIMKKTKQKAPTSVPIKDERIVLHVRVSKKDLELLKSINADVPEIVRQAIKDAAGCELISKKTS